MYSTQEARTELAFTLAKNAFTYMQAAKKKHWQVGEGWVTTLSGEPFEMLNEVLLFGANPDSVDEAIAVLAERGVPAYIKVIGPAQNVIPRLIERGYEFKYTSPVMTWQADNSLDGFGELGGTLTDLRSNLNFPKYFLDESGKNQRVLTPLTKREREVLLLLPRGITAKAMASELFLTEATIKSHLASIYQKFEVVNRTQAIAIGIENKLLAF